MISLFYLDGFIWGRSTTDTSVELMKHVLDTWEDSHDVIGVFCIVAFDRVYHDTPVRKFCLYVVVGCGINLLKFV